MLFWTATSQNSIHLYDLASIKKSMNRAASLLYTAADPAADLYCAYLKLTVMFKGIVSDSNNIFLWHKSEDINQK